MVSSSNQQKKSIGGGGGGRRWEECGVGRKTMQRGEAVDSRRGGLRLDTNRTATTIDNRSKYGNQRNKKIFHIPELEPDLPLPSPLLLPLLLLLALRSTICTRRHLRRLGRSVGLCPCHPRLQENLGFGSLNVWVSAKSKKKTFQDRSRRPWNVAAAERISMMLPARIASQHCIIYVSQRTWA